MILQSGDMEEITRKTGSFKRFEVLVKMLLSALQTESSSVYVDLLTFSDLEALRQKRLQGSTSRASVASHASSRQINKRYLILTYASEYERVHYPLPLSYEQQPSHTALQRTIRRLRQARELSEAHRGHTSQMVASPAEIDHQQKMAKLAAENAQLRSQLEQAVTAVNPQELNRLRQVLQGEREAKAALQREMEHIKQKAKGDIEALRVKLQAVEAGAQAAASASHNHSLLAQSNAQLQQSVNHLSQQLREAHARVAELQQQQLELTQRSKHAVHPRGRLRTPSPLPREKRYAPEVTSSGGSRKSKLSQRSARSARTASSQRSGRSVRRSDGRQPRSQVQKRVASQRRFGYLRRATSVTSDDDSPRQQPARSTSRGRRLPITQPAKSGAALRSKARSRSVRGRRLDPARSTAASRSRSVGRSRSHSRSRSVSSAPSDSDASSVRRRVNPRYRHVRGKLKTQPVLRSKKEKRLGKRSGGLKSGWSSSEDSTRSGGRMTDRRRGAPAAATALLSASDSDSDMNEQTVGRGARAHPPQPHTTLLHSHHMLLTPPRYDNTEHHQPRPLAHANGTRHTTKPMDTQHPPGLSTMSNVESTNIQPHHQQTAQQVRAAAPPQVPITPERSTEQSHMEMSESTRYLSSQVRSSVQSQRSSSGVITAPAVALNSSSADTEATDIDKRLKALRMYLREAQSAPPVRINSTPPA